MAINWNNNVNENSENNEINSENNSNSLIDKLYAKFVDDGLKNKWAKFVSNFYDFSNLYTNKKIEELYEFSKNIPEFSSLTIDVLKNKVDFSKIKMKLFNVNSEYKSKKLKIKNLIINNFVFLDDVEIDNTNFENKISSNLLDIELDKLNKYSSNISELEKFIFEKRIKIKKTNNSWEILSVLSGFWLDKIIDKLSDDKKQELSYLFEELKSLDVNSTLFQSKIEWILSSIFDIVPDYSFKEKILKKYVSNVSVKNAKNLWLFNISDNNFKQKFKNYFNLSDSEVDEVLNKSDIDSVDIPIDILLQKWNWEVLKSLFENVKSEISSEISNCINDKSNVINLDSLVKELWKSKKVTWLDNFKKWNVINIQQKLDNWSIVNLFYEIYSINTEPKSLISVIERWWNNVFDSWKDKKVSNLDFDMFLEKVNSEKVLSLDFIDFLEIEEKIKSWLIKEFDSNLYVTKSDIQSKKWNYSEILKSQIVSELIRDWRIKDETEYDNYIYKNEDTLEKYTFEIYNKSKVKEKLDLVDEKWKSFLFDKWLTFYSNGEWNKWCYYTVEDLVFDDYLWKIKLSRIWWGVESINFEDFCSTFASSSCRRTANVNWLSSLVADVNSQENLWWTSYVVENNKIINNKDSKNKYECDVFSSNWNGAFLDDSDLIKVHSINWNSASVSFWKLEKDWNKINYSFESGKNNISLWILSSFIKKAWLIPENIEKKEEELNKNPEKDKVDESNLKSKWWSYYVNNFYSINNLLTLGKNYADFWKDYFEEWNREKSTKLLAKMPVLTKEQKAALVRYQENNEKKRMDEFLEKLKVLTSKDAVWTVEMRITDKNSSEAQKEAAMMFMIEKYGSLYTKKAMMKHKWSFLWYRALGWKVWDDLYNKVKKESLQNEWWITNFTEEKLIHRLLKMQCEEWWKPKRRWKLYKEYEAIIWNGRSSEKEKWNKDAVKKRNFSDRLNFAIWELADWSWPNAMWAMDAIVWKWNDWNVASLNALPFVMMTSWAAYSFDEEDADQFKNSIVPTQFFISRSSFVDVYNKTFLQLSKDIEAKFWWKYVWMWAKAEKLVNWMRDKSETDRVRAAQDFYLKEHNWAWWDIIWRAMMFLNTRYTDKEAEFETWISDNSDKVPVYKEYENIFFWWTWNNKDARLKATDIYDDWFKCDVNTIWTWWTTAWWMYDIVRKYLEPQSWWVWFRDDTSWSNTLVEIQWQINSIIVNENLSDEYKKNRLSWIIRPTLEALKKSYWQNPATFKSIFENKANNLYNLFNQLWLKQEDFLLWDFTDSTNNDINNLLNRLLGNLLINWINTNLNNIDPIIEAQNFIKWKSESVL